MIWKRRVLKLHKLERKNEQNEHKLRDFWDNNKNTNICLVGSQKEKEGKKGRKLSGKELIAGNFTKLQKETDTWVQEAQKVLNKMNPRGP